MSVREVPLFEVLIIEVPTPKTAEVLKIVNHLADEIGRAHV